MGMEENSKHTRAFSLGSFKYEEEKTVKIPLKLVIRVHGYLDFFSLQPKHKNSKFKEFIQKSPLISNRLQLNTPEKFDLQSVSSLASDSISKTPNFRNILR